MIVRRTGIVHRPHKIVKSVTIEHIRRFTESIILQASPFRSQYGQGILLDGKHILIQLGACHIAITPIQIGFSRNRIGKHIHINLLSVAHRRFGEDGMSQVFERTGGRIGYRHPDLLAASGCRVTTEIEKIFILSVHHFFFNTWSPRVSIRPCHLVGFQIKHHPFIFPVLQIIRREDTEIPSAPSGLSVGGGIDIIFFSLMRIQYLGVSMETLQHGIVGNRHIAHFL